MTTQLETQVSGYLGRMEEPNTHDVHELGKGN